MSTRLPTSPATQWPAWIDTLAVTVVALLVAAPGLGSPATLVFDELYYVSDAISHLEVGVGRSFQAHPPLGPWLVAIGIRVVENGPVGWRIVSLLSGVATVTLLHRLALAVLPAGRLRRPTALAAAALLVSDGSWLILSRTAMLDGPLTASVLAAVTCAVASIRSSHPHLRLRWSAATGLCLGAATAVKWSAALAMLVIIGLLVVVLRPRGAVRPLLTATLVAAIVYAAAWVPFALRRDDIPVATCPEVSAPCPETGGIAGVLSQHAMLTRYHTGIQLPATEASPPWTWPLLGTPVSFFRPDCHTLTAPVDDPLGSGEECLPVGPDDDTIVYSGNPVVWYGFLALVPALAALARGSARRRSPDALGGIVAFFGWSLQWLPWLAVTRTSYLWYLAPAVPFMALGTVVATSGLARIRIAPTYGAAVGGTIAGALVSLVPGVPPGRPPRGRPRRLGARRTPDATSGARR